MTPLQAAKDIVERLSKAGYKAFFVGGWVRDHLLNKPSKDIDIATSASPLQIQQLFPKTIPTGISFGIIVVVHHKHSFEVATFREDKVYLDGRRPSGIICSTPERDVQRRDFTINGLLFDPLTETIYDFVEGKKDLQQHIIRAIGNPIQRFQEDRLRMLRAVRYAVALSFSIDPSTKQAILLLAKHLRPSVSVERIWEEMKKIDKQNKLGPALSLLHHLQLLQAIFPSTTHVNAKQLSFTIKNIHNMQKVPLCLKLFLLAQNDHTFSALTFCEEWKLSREEKKCLQFYQDSTEFLEKSLCQPQPSLHQFACFHASPYAPSCIKAFGELLSETEKNHFFNTHTHMQTKLAPAIQRLQSGPPYLTAHELKKHGIPPGKTLGLLLKEAEKIAINDNVSSPTQLLLHLQRSPLWPPAQSSSYEHNTDN